jgi:hypothetical protein
MAYTEEGKYQPTLKGFFPDRLLPQILGHGMPLNDAEYKTLAHAFLNSRDVPKDAAEKPKGVTATTSEEYLTAGDSAYLYKIIERLYYIAPGQCVKGPGTKGVGHIVEKLLEKDTDMKQKINSPMEIASSSAHGPSIKVDMTMLGLNYIFIDSGRTVVNMLGDDAAMYAYSSPTNLIDSAKVSTKRMDTLFLDQKVITIARSETLKRFGFRLTTEIKMYNVSAGVAPPESIRGIIPVGTEYLITFNINENALPQGVSPLSNPMIMAFDIDHKQIPIESYEDGTINILNPGNKIKNKYLKSLKDKALNPKQIFLQHFLIEVKLLGDTNHCMFSYELINGTALPAAPAQLIGGGGGGGIIPFIPPPNQRNIAFGTCDYDLTLRFILEGINIFYKEGVCSKYYTGKKMNPLERVIYLNENTISLINKFRADLDKGNTQIYFEGSDYRVANIPYNKGAQIQLYIHLLLSVYGEIMRSLTSVSRLLTDALSRDPSNQGILENISKLINSGYYLRSPVIVDPRDNGTVEWVLSKKFSDMINFRKLFYSHTSTLGEEEMKGYISDKMGTVIRDIEGLSPEIPGGGSGTSGSKRSRENDLSSVIPKKARVAEDLTAGQMIQSIGDMRQQLDELKMTYIQMLKMLEEYMNPTAGMMGGGGGSSSSSSSRKMRKQHGGALSDYPMIDYPGLITYLLVTEYRDILKFAFAVYTCFCKDKDPELHRFLYITQNEETVHMLIDILSYQENIDTILEESNPERIETHQREAEAAAAAEAETPAMEEEGAAATAAGGVAATAAGGAATPAMEEEGSAATAAGGEAAAAMLSLFTGVAPKTEKKYKSYDDLTFEVCKYALHGVMYFKDTYNPSCSEFNKGKIDSLLRIIVAILDLQDPSKRPDSFSIFESLRRGDILETDLTQSTKNHLSATKGLFTDKGKGYREIVNYFDTIDNHQPQPQQHLTVGGGGGGGQSGGAYYTREVKEDKKENAFEILDLHRSKVPEILHEFSFYENMLAVWGERRNVNIVDVIYNYCSEAAAKVEAEAEEAALLAKGIPSAAPRTGQSTAPRTGQSTAPSTPKRPTKPQEGSVGTADPFMSPGGSTFGNGRSRSSSLGSLLNFSSTQTRLNRERQEFQKGEGKFGIIKTGGNPRKYDNRRTRRNRKARNPTRKL